MREMGKGNRSGGMGLGGDEVKEGSLLECDVGLGLKVQPTEAFQYCREMMGMPHFSSYQHHHHHHHHLSSSECMSMGTVGFFGVGGGGGGGVGPSYSNSSNRISCGSDIYDFVGAGGAPELPNFKSSGGGMKVAFTGVQRQELERQTMIYKYMIASIPVPSQLLIPINKTPPSHLPSSQSNTCGLNLRYSSGSDPEPWRCRRTDGKKWRCSRDVVPDHKYCERHVRKSKPRSRKPVESQPPHTTTTPTPTPTYLNTPNAHQPFHKPTIHFPTMASGATYVDQTRCSEWFMKGDTIPVSTLNQQWQQVMPSSSSSSSRVGLKRDNTDLDKNVSFFQRHYGEEQEPLSLNSYMGICDSQALHNQQLNDPKLTHLQGISINADERTQRTRHFIDTLSSAEREEMNEISNKCSVSSSSGKLPISSSLTLSMSGGNGNDEETENTQMDVVGMMDLERESDESFKSQWLNPISWMDSPPGGPLGEALCLGIASTAKAASNVPSPHGYSNSTSSCSKGSYEDCDHGLNFTKRP